MTTPTQFPQVLQQMPLFRSLSPEAQAVLAAATTRRRFDAGQVIYLEGEPAEAVYILETGWVKATRMTREGGSRR